MIRQTVVGLLAAGLVNAAASAGSAPPLTLRDAESRALAANPRLQAAQLDAVAASKRAAIARGAQFGQIDFVGMYNHYESQRLVRPMAIDLFKNPAAGFGQLPWDQNQTHYGIVWQIPLLAVGLHEGARIARLSQSATEHLALFTREEVLLNVRAAYRNALVVRHALAAAVGYREALAKDEADARLKERVGAWAPVDVHKVTFALRGAEAQMADLAAQEESAQALLAALMGEEPPAEGLDLEDEAEVETSVTEVVTAPDAHAAALAGREDLAAVRERTRSEEHRKRLAQSAFLPQLVLQGSWLRNDAPSLSEPLDTHEWSLSVKVPLFAGLSRVRAVEEANANLRAAREREKAKRLEIAAQVAEAHARLSAARALYEAGQAQRALGREVARVERLKLDQGTGKAEDYLAARGQELAGETAYWRGLYARRSAADYFNFVSAQRREP